MKQDIIKTLPALIHGVDKNCRTTALHLLQLLINLNDITKSNGKPYNSNNSNKYEFLYFPLREAPQIGSLFSVSTQSLHYVKYFLSGYITYMSIIIVTSIIFIIMTVIIIVHI